MTIDAEDLYLAGNNANPLGQTATGSVKFISKTVLTCRRGPLAARNRDGERPLQKHWPRYISKMQENLQENSSVT